FVRDDIKHSADIDGKIVTCKASEVLKYRQGICYAKSHLLAAMLRFLGIPTGLCYQKLLLNDDTAPYIILHGLNAVFIRDIGRWIRLDARGNIGCIDAQFSIEHERLAFHVRKEKREEDIWTIFSNPDKSVIDRLNQYDDTLELYNNLPSKLLETVN
ncbi:transglutaminase-like domain-containing protein, partial [Herbivorax sp. ANBcel31]|uniref:transglutaminase-like domain-containing protein n=1 Tax=Herbivorax sp. ANBcel31 TaxID=3069754 RepID=UPI0027B57798